LRLVAFAIARRAPVKRRKRSSGWLAARDRVPREAIVRAGWIVRSLAVEPDHADRRRTTSLAGGKQSPETHRVARRAECCLLALCDSEPVCPGRRRCSYAGTLAALPRLQPYFSFVAAGPPRCRLPLWSAGDPAGLQRCENRPRADASGFVIGEVLGSQPRFRGGGHSWPFPRVGLLDLEVAGNAHVLRCADGVSGGGPSASAARAPRPGATLLGPPGVAAG